MTRVRISGHLGELLQGRLGPAGPVALITLPAPRLWVEVSRRPGAFHLHQPDGRAVSRPMFRGLCTALGQPMGGRWVVRCNMPIGAGAGASSATLLAIARLLRPDLPDETVERICVGIEGASDPLLRPRPETVLWASRSGQDLRKLPEPPPMRIVGGFQAGVHWTDPTDDDFPDIADLVALWSSACADLDRLGTLVTEASRRRFRQLGQDMASLENLAATHGAKGIAIAHTGTGRAFLLPPDNGLADALERRLQAMGWRHVQNYQLERR